MRQISYILSIIVLILLAGTASAQETQLESYNANYQVVGDTAIVTETLMLDQPKEFIWKVPKNSIAVEVKGLTFQETNIGLYKVLTINTPKTEIVIRYINGDSIEQNKDSFFILDVGNIKSQEKQVTLELPQSATLKYPIGSPTPSIIPQTDKVTTDGKHIIITWNNEDLQDNTALLTIFNQEPDDYTAILTIVFIIILIAVLISKNKKKVHRAHKSVIKESSVNETDITRNLFEEEKLIVEILLKEPKRELWQKQLEIKTGLSKVKLSRKLRNLLQKGVIEKIPYGNTNKIRIKAHSSQ